MLRCLLLSLVVLSVTACVTVPRKQVNTVSVRYDPYSYSIGKLRKSADSACMSKGFRGAYDEPLIENDPDDPDDDKPETIRWAYMEFECF